MSTIICMTDVENEVRELTRKIIDIGDKKRELLKPLTTEENTLMDRRRKLETQLKDFRKMNEKALKAKTPNILFTFKDGTQFRTYMKLPHQTGVKFVDLVNMIDIHGLPVDYSVQW